MRRTFARKLAEAMEGHPEIHVLVADLGYGMFDDSENGAIRTRFADRFWNVRAAEQAMVGMAVGMARGGLIPVCYTITPFLLWRPAELIRNYLHQEKVPVILVGSGRDRDYEHDGPTHWGEDDAALLELWPNITAWWPTCSAELESLLHEMLLAGRPTYINLCR
jgi:transketolase